MRRRWRALVGLAWRTMRAIDGLGKFGEDRIVRESLDRNAKSPAGRARLHPLLAWYCFCGSG